MVELRHRFAALGAALIVLGMVGGVGAASAQTTTTPTTYTPGTSVPPPCAAGPANAGTVAIGQTVTFALCGVFKPGTSVNLTVDGQSGGPAKTAGTHGTVGVTITINSATVAAVNDPTNVNISCGANTASATGTGLDGGTATQTGTFTVLCASTATTGGIAFTGANVMKGLLAALLLIALGAALVLTQRRRHHSSRPL